MLFSNANLSPKGFTFLEDIVKNPIRATLSVGTSILALLFTLRWVAHYYPPVGFLQYVVPFIPPFIVTSLARRIQARSLEHHVVSEAAPYMFVAFPATATQEALLRVRPTLLSRSTSEHLHCPYDELLTMPSLPEEFIASKDAHRVVITLLEIFHKQPGKAVVKDVLINIQTRRGEVQRYILCSTLVSHQGRLRWQATLIKADHLRYL